MKIRFCKDYTYFNIGMALGSIIDSLVLTINLGFWSIEVIIIERPEPKRFSYRNMKGS